MAGQAERAARGQAFRRWGVVLALTALLVPPGVGGQEPGGVGTVLVAHGGSAEWNGRVHALAGQVDTGGPVEVSFLMGPEAARHPFQEVVQRLEASNVGLIAVIPVLASSHSGHYEQLRYLTHKVDTLEAAMMHHLDMAGITRPTTTLRLVLTPAIDASMELVDILADRALSLADEPSEQALFLLAHGPTSAQNYAAWMSNLRPVADSLARRTSFRSVRLGLLRDDAPTAVREEAVRSIRETIALQATLTERPVVVVPILVSKGYISTRKIPHDLEGLPVTYDGEGLLPHPNMARWVERRVMEAEQARKRPL